MADNTASPRPGTLEHTLASVDMTKLFTMLCKLDTDMKSRFDGISSQITDMRDEFKSLKHDVEELDRGLRYADEEITELKDETIPKLQKDLMDKINDLQQAKLETELYSKKCNLLFFNIPQNDHEDCEVVLRGVLSKSDIPSQKVKDIIFANVHRLPTKSRSTDKPIIAKFVRMCDRDLVLNGITKCKDIILHDKPVLVAPHLPAPMQQERKRLMPIRKKLRDEGKNAKIRVVGTKVLLFVNNVTWEDNEK